jgi:hypothetical protein
MKLCHAVALALVGWYLMVPPIPKGQIPDTSVPLSEWSLSASFDTAKECEKGRVDNWSLFHKLSLAHPNPDTISAVQAAVEAACIATDDPRLKK